MEDNTRRREFGSQKAGHGPRFFRFYLTHGKFRAISIPKTHPIFHFGAYTPYDSRADLGNLGPPDGERFKGRGFIQLTGRANYAFHSAAIGLGEQLIETPGLANDPAIAAGGLASLLKAHDERIR